MKIARKEDTFKPQYKEEVREWKKGPPVNWREYEIDDEAIIPYGKYKGQEAEMIRYDDFYWKWMHSQQLWGDWGLVKLRYEKPKRTGVGTYWNEWYNVIEMIIVDQPSTPVEQDWLVS